MNCKGWDSDRVDVRVVSRVYWDVLERGCDERVLMWEIWSKYRSRSWDHGDWLGWLMCLDMRLLAK